MIKFLCGLLTVTLFIACQKAPDSEAKMAESSPNGKVSTRLAASAVNDPLFVGYAVALVAKRQAALTDKHNFGNYNGQIFAAGKANVRSKQDLIDLYTKAGITNVEELVDVNAKLLWYYGKIRQKYPEITQLTNNQFIQLIGSVQTANGMSTREKDVKDAFYKRLRTTPAGLDSIIRKARP